MVELNQYLLNISSINNLQKSSRAINYKIMFITCNYQSKKLEYINALRFYSDYTNFRPASLHYYWESLQLSPMRHFLWQESFHLTHLCILVARNPDRSRRHRAILLWQETAVYRNWERSDVSANKLLGAFSPFHIKVEGTALAQHFYCRSNGHHPTVSRVALTGGFI